MKISPKESPPRVRCRGTVSERGPARQHSRGLPCDSASPSDRSLKAGDRP